MIIRILLFGFTALLTWSIHIANTGRSHEVFAIVQAIPNGDKISHFFMMGIFAYLVNLFLECKTFRIGPINVLTGSVIVFLCVFAEELSQMFIPSRTFSEWDLLSDVLGIITFSYLAIKTYPLFSRRHNGLSSAN